MFKLNEILPSIKAKRTEGELNLNIEDIAYDSRKAIPGSLFVCVKGLKTNGHLYIDQAIKLGAVAVVTEHWQDIPDSITQIQVQNSRETLALLSKVLFDDPSFKLKLVGITGTNGKTTTSYLVESIFKKAGKKTGLIGTIEYKIGDNALPVKRTTPESYDLQKILKKMLDEGVTHVVMEVSSHAIDLHRVDGCHFDVLVFTNLSQDHLDYHNSMSEYFKVKQRLFENHNDAVKVINIDDPYGKIIASNGQKIVSYGLTESAEIKGDKVSVRWSGSKFKLLTSTLTLDLSIKLKGLFNVYNSLAAIGVGLSMKILPETIKAGVEDISSVPGRFEAIDCGQKFGVFVDYAHTPDGMEQLIKAAGEIAKGRIITVFGCGGDRDRKKRPLMGEIAGRLSDFVIITSDNPRSEKPMKIIKEIEDGLLNMNYSDYLVIEDRKEAICRAISLAKTDDVVLITGKGHETGQIFDNKTIPFDDREVAMSILRKLMSC
ncbi:UDP-N-acetylmuramoyl-L-alanyl-D-glutamate--2,6-diaminopimelate ligase [Candidatus Oleimmundimicrobium sp.]|uniref:UDP-N-acetylmuramoyl-L-alanyl-D-glutamate--2, 6-diaminopimelate ligase n=1 Tax=Candidatus Oleimmundimicrobium sp. TaxID=3060597 RepID=UPI00271B1672|nr:UDP-N-acetylmuramoyl-L-alanyl-D-glutamate--2,6-diaminopimelate ligase [Candidatus Oleimmundimicrobium sp.]MDO8885504.1 UDP-N-acetylmuramoyl-L-alanyl-D-glutamate--2,6-diaminopimelate ligase [Candidatus Oleimmundimicrobium sp.]